MPTGSIEFLPYLHERVVASPDPPAAVVERDLRVVTRAYDLMGRGAAWIQRQYSRGDGFCSVGALQRAALEVYGDQAQAFPITGRLCGFWFRPLIPPGPWVMSDPVQVLIGFNDFNDWRTVDALWVRTIRRMEVALEGARARERAMVVHAQSALAEAVHAASTRDLDDGADCAYCRRMRLRRYPESEGGNSHPSTTAGSPAHALVAPGWPGAEGVAGVAQPVAV